MHSDVQIRKKLVWAFAHYVPGPAAGHAIDREFDRKEFWVSRADGTGITELGWVRYVSDRRRPNQVFPEAVEWTPDSEHISFVYKDALYSVPAQ